MDKRGRCREAQEERDICVHTVDSHCCTGETDNTVKQLYSNLKDKSNILINKMDTHTKESQKIWTEISTKEIEMSF